MAEVRLTAEERERFENHLRWHFNVVAEQGDGSSYISLGILNAVGDMEAILAARLAAVEALAVWCDEQVLGQSFRPGNIAAAIRKALTAAEPTPPPAAAVRGEGEA